MIKINKLNFGYGKQAPLFQDLSLDLAQGGIVGLLGKNGAGKSSLLKLLAGLLFADPAECQVFDTAPRYRSPSLLSELFIIPEDISLPDVTSTQYAQLYSPFYPGFDQALFAKSLDVLEVSANKRIAQLSHGQRKKVLLAFAIATQCRLLLLDEPTNGLDIPAKTQFRTLLAEQYHEDRLIIISTHQIHDIEKIIDRIVILEQGKILLNQTLQSISERLQFTVQKTEPDLGSCIYTERQLGGYVCLNYNREQLATEVDLEILFNATIQHAAAIQAAFKG